MDHFPFQSNSSGTAFSQFQTCVLQNVGVEPFPRRELEQICFGIQQEDRRRVDVHQGHDPVEQHGEKQIQVQPGSDRQIDRTQDG